MGQVDQLGTERRSADMDAGEPALRPLPTGCGSGPYVWLLGVVGDTVVAESRWVSGRYTVRTAEEAARPWVGVAGAWAPPGMVVAGRSLHMDPAPREPARGRGRLRDHLLLFWFCFLVLLSAGRCLHPVCSRTPLFGCACVGVDPRMEHTS